jgi:hypothetical protein
VVVVAALVVVVDAPVEALVTSGPAAVAVAVAVAASVALAAVVVATELRLLVATAAVPVVAVDTAAALALRAGGKRTVTTPTRPTLKLPRSFRKTHLLFRLSAGTTFFSNCLLSATRFHLFSHKFSFRLASKSGQSFAFTAHQ